MTTLTPVRFNGYGTVPHQVYVVRERVLNFAKHPYLECIQINMDNGNTVLVDHPLHQVSLMLSDSTYPLTSPEEFSR